MSATIALLTDFGADSHYVGQMKGKILGINPRASVVDITHSIRPQNIVEASYVLRDSIEAFNPGTIFVAVVDPGVGTSRGIVKVDANQQTFVLPNNGLISQIANDFEATSTEINQAHFDPCATFHGRDIMAPLAARISLGESIEEIQLGPTTLHELDSEKPQLTMSAAGVEVNGRIVYCDRFGNLISNISIDVLQGSPGRSLVRFKQHSIDGISETYGQQKAGELMALIGSNGRLEIAVNQGDAASRLNGKAGDEIKVVIG